MGALPDESFESASMADSQTIAAIVQVQDILEERCGLGGGSALLMPQLLDIGAEELLLKTGIQNYVLSSRLAARIMAMICELPHYVSIIDCFVKSQVCKFTIARLSDYPTATRLDFKGGVSFNE